MRAARYVRSLSATEGAEIENLFRHGPNERTRKRANAIRLSALGYTVLAIAEVLGCNPQSIRNWINSFEASGVGGLYDKPRSGRPPKATADYRQRLLAAIKTNPYDLGYPFTVWTITRIRAHMAREINVLISASRVRQVMKEEGLVFKRPKHSLSMKRNADAFASVRHLLDEAKKNPWNPVPMSNSSS